MGGAPHRRRQRPAVDVRQDRVDRFRSSQAGARHGRRFVGVQNIKTFERCALGGHATDRQAEFVHVVGDGVKFGAVATESGQGVAPELDAGQSWRDPRLPGRVKGHGAHIVAQDPSTAILETGRQGRLSRAGWPGQGDGVVIQHDGVGVQGQNAALVQDRAHHRPQQIETGVARRRVRGRIHDDRSTMRRTIPTRRGLQPEVRLIDLQSAVEGARAVQVRIDRAAKYADIVLARARGVGGRELGQFDIRPDGQAEGAVAPGRRGGGWVGVHAARAPRA